MHRFLGSAADLQAGREGSGKLREEFGRAACEADETIALMKDYLQSPPGGA